MPPPGAFLTEEGFIKEGFFPLRIAFCEDCKFVQLVDIVSKTELFQKHFYLSSISKTLSQHFSDYANEIVETFKPKIILEIGSNDGVLLEPFRKLGVRAIGVEPCKQVADVSKSRNLETIVDFFTESLARKLVKKVGKVDVITANNVFAHIDGLDDVMRGVQVLLKDNGIFVFEVQYLVDLIEKLQYDFIYHEHMSYYSIMALQPYFEKFDMEIFDVKRMPTHSGSIRVFVRRTGSRKGPISKNIENLLALERRLGLDMLKTFIEFSRNVKSHKVQLIKVLKKIKAQGKTIVGFGAGGRCSVLTNYCKITSDLVNYIGDDSPFRQNKYVPGVHIPVVSLEKLHESKPDYILLFAWNYAGEIMKKHQAYIDGGGKFIVPLPKISVVP